MLTIPWKSRSRSRGLGAHDPVETALTIPWILQHQNDEPHRVREAHEASAKGFRGRRSGAQVVLLTPATACAAVHWPGMKSRPVRYGDEVGLADTASLKDGVQGCQPPYLGGGIGREVIANGELPRRTAGRRKGYRMPRIYYNKTPIVSVDSLLSNFKGKALQSPMRSTVPLLDMALHAQSHLTSVVGNCGAEPESELRFEYEASSGSGSARPSHTDIMVLGSSRAVAVEAKWTEPPYENVAIRLLRRTKLREKDLSAEALALDRAHQEAEVGSWLRILQPIAYESLTTASVAGVVYQMIHRAASAIATGLSPSLLYLHFDDKETQLGATSEIYKADLARLYQKLGRPSGFRFYVATQPIQRTAVFRTIEGLNRTLSSTCSAVREAIKAGPLFIYGPADIEQVE